MTSEPFGKPTPILTQPKLSNKFYVLNLLFWSQPVEKTVFHILRVIKGMNIKRVI